MYRMFTNSHVMKNRNRGKKINIILLKNKFPDHLIIKIEVVCNINKKTMSIKSITNRSIWHCYHRSTWHCYTFQAINLKVEILSKWGHGWTIDGHVIVTNWSHIHRGIVYTSSLSDVFGVRWQVVKPVVKLKLCVWPAIVSLGCNGESTWSIIS